MDRLLLAALLLAMSPGCGDNQRTRPDAVAPADAAIDAGIDAVDAATDAAVDARPDAAIVPTCDELECGKSDLIDPGCLLTGALCKCRRGDAVITCAP